MLCHVGFNKEWLTVWCTINSRPYRDYSRCLSTIVDWKGRRAGIFNGKKERGGKMGNGEEFSILRPFSGLF